MTDNLVPTADLGEDIGTAAKRWGEIHGYTGHFNELGLATTGISADASDDSTKLATTEHVKDAIAAFVYDYPIELRAEMMYSPTNDPLVWGQSAEQSNGVAYVYVDLAYNTLRRAQWRFSLPETWNGAVIPAKINAVNNSALSGNVIYEIYGGRCGDGLSVNMTLSLLGTITDTVTGTAFNWLSDPCNLTIPGTGNTVVLELRRKYADAGDTLDTSIRVLGINLLVPCTLKVPVV